MHLKRKKIRKTGRYKIGCHVALEREVLGHPTLLEFLYFFVFFMFFLCLISFKSLRGCVKFFTDYQGNTTYVKCVCLFHVFMAGIPTAEIAKRQYFGRYIKYSHDSICQTVGKSSDDFRRTLGQQLNPDGSVTPLCVCHF